MGGKMKKYYAIMNGRTIGIVTTWEECKNATQGFSNAQFKGFDTKEEAENYLNHNKKNTVPKPSQGKVHPKKNTDYIIYTDGSCLKNPGPGGYAAIIIDTYSKKIKEVSGGDADTTNNRMELSAAIAALSVIPKQSNIVIYTDSQYMKNAFTSGWLKNWKISNWKTSSGSAVKNVDLWRSLDDLVSQFNIEWNWVKGHSNVEYNERCDELANKEACKYKMLGANL